MIRPGDLSLELELKHGCARVKVGQGVGVPHRAVEKAREKHTAGVWDTMLYLPWVLAAAGALQPAAAAAAAAEHPIRFATSFGDSMVLQRGPGRAKVWGFGPAGENVTVRIVGVSGDAAAASSPVASDGVWSVLLPALEPTREGEALELHATTATAAAVLSDVVVGDVWMCSGQSNMVFGTSMAHNGSQFVQEANKHGASVRVFGMGKCQSFEPSLEPAAVSPGWTRASNVSVGQGWGHLSAICYLYGVRIHASTGIAIGLIEADVGGVALHTLAPPAALAKCGVPPLNKSQERPLWPTECSGFDGGVKSSVDICCTNPPNFVVPPTPRANALSVLWKAMVLPFTRTVIRGAIWFQGESDSSSTGAAAYNCTFPAMIDAWRQEWHMNTDGETARYFPFGFVSLGAVGCSCPAGQPRSMCSCPGNASPDFAALRWSQTAGYGYVPNPAMPATFQAQAYDLPDELSAWGTVHFREKSRVADRLASAALAEVYRTGGDGSQYHSGPVISRVVAVYGGGARLATVAFSPAGPAVETPLRTAGGFQLGYDDLVESRVVWFNVTASAPASAGAPVRQVELSGVLPAGVSHSQVLYARYNWATSPCAFDRCAVYADRSSAKSAGVDMPAGPFVGHLEHQPVGEVAARPVSELAWPVTESTSDNRLMLRMHETDPEFQRFLASEVFFGPVAQRQTETAAATSTAEQQISPQLREQDRQTERDRQSDRATERQSPSSSAPELPPRYRIQLQYQRDCGHGKAPAPGAKEPICTYDTTIDIDLTNSSLSSRGTTPWGYANLKTINRTTHIFDYGVSCSRELKLQVVTSVPPTQDMQHCGTETLKNGTKADKYCYTGAPQREAHREPIASTVGLLLGDYQSLHMRGGQRDQVRSAASETVWYAAGTNRPLLYVSAAAEEQGVYGGRFEVTSWTVGLANGSLLVPAVWCPPCEEMPPSVL